MSADHPLTSQDTVIVLAQALTGLGHLRVSHALYHGLPPGAHALLLSSQDERVNYLHKVTSLNPFMRRVMEFTQGGWAEDSFTGATREYFRQNTRLLSEQLQTILEQHVTKPRILLVVATHTFLGHQLAAIKDEFEKKNSVRLVIIVVVTDDSPQHIWAVGGADLIFVPSEHTKRQLEQYHHRTDMPASTYVVAPYMVSPRLGLELAESQLRRRKQEVDPTRLAGIQVSIPVSGAAVQLLYLEKLIRELDVRTNRFVYHIISHQSPGTSEFLGRMIGKPHIKLHVSSSHREVVELYEALFESEVIALEVTKPSEQSFKALLKPRQRGGVILLFSEPVGRQERDNLHFLIRHNLLPTADEQTWLWRAAAANRPPNETILLRCHSWRALRLPLHSAASAQFIWWCLEHKVFASMMRFAGFPETPELSSRGVEIFWKRVNEYLTHL